MHRNRDTIPIRTPWTSQGYMRFMIHPFNDARECTRANTWATYHAGCFLVSSLLILAQVLQSEEGFCRSLPLINIYSNTFTAQSFLDLWLERQYPKTVSRHLILPLNSWRDQEWQIVSLDLCYTAVVLRRDPSKTSRCGSLEHNVRISETTGC